MTMILIPVLTYSRVCGYYQPVEGWYKGKKEEFKERHNYTEKDVEDFIDGNRTNRANIEKQ